MKDIINSGFASAEEAKAYNKGVSDAFDVVNNLRCEQQTMKTIHRVNTLAADKRVDEAFTLTCQELSTRIADLRLPEDE